MLFYVIKLLKMAASSKQQKLDTFFTIEHQAKSTTLTPNSNTTTSKCSNKQVQSDLDNDESSISIPSSDMVCPIRRGSSY